MFKIVTSLTLFLLGLLAKAQHDTRTETFHALNVNNNATVVFTPGPDCGFSYQADAKTAAGLITRVHNGTLYISQKDGIPVKIFVTAPLLDDIVASQHALVIAISSINTGDFSLGLASGARFNGTVNASRTARLRNKGKAVFNILLHTQSVEAAFASGAKVNLSGTAWAGNIATHGNAFCLARNFRLENAKIDATGLSEIQVCVNGSIDVSTADQATVRYFGTPEKMRTDAQSVATITQ